MNKKWNFSASILNPNAEKAQVFAILFDQSPLNPIANQISIQAGVGALQRTESIYKTFPKSFSLPKAMLFLISMKDRRTLPNVNC